MHRLAPSIGEHTKVVALSLAMTTTVKWICQAGVFLLHLLFAWLGTAALVSVAEHPTRLSPVSHLILQEDLLSSVAAAGLGYSVYRIWRSQPMRWVWLGGLLWFARGAFRSWSEQRTLGVLQNGHSIFWDMSGIGCSFDTRSCRDWAVYSVTSLRTIFYSVGAVCCAVTRNCCLQRKAARSEAGPNVAGT